MDSECIFCKIITGELPSYKIFDNENTIVILDNRPINPGHLLVLPKIHYSRLSDIDEINGFEIFKTVLLVEKIVSKSGCSGTNLFQNNGKAAGQEIEHVHFHIVPRFTNDTFKFKYRKVSVSVDMFNYSLKYYKTKLNEILNSQVND